MAADVRNPGETCAGLAFIRALKSRLRVRFGRSWARGRGASRGLGASADEKPGSSLTGDSEIVSRH